MKYTEPLGFSKLDVFRQCKAKFKYQFMDKRKGDDSSPALERGNLIHKNIEEYLNGWTQELHPDVLDWKDAFDAVKAKDYKGEQALGISKDWILLPDWFDKRTWIRVKMDTYYVENGKIVVIDYKTGKYRIPSTEQVELYAIAGLSIAPEIKEAIAEMWFLDAGETYTRTYTKDELLALRTKYIQEFDKIHNHETWEPEPSSACRYCPYSKTKGGPCKY